MTIVAPKAAFDEFVDYSIASGAWHSKQPLISAVSGGPDSFALALIAQDYARRTGTAHRAVIIDHRLRCDSAQEAQAVAQRLRDRSITVEIKTVSPPLKQTGLQEWARWHRLAYLAHQSRQSGALVLFAHHQNDQAETAAIRLGRQTGLRGLGAIARLRVYQGGLFGRPFLALPKTSLIAVCHAAGADYMRDPSNQNRAFERVRWRQFLATKPEMTEELIRLADRARKISDYLDKAVELWMSAHLHLDYRLRARCQLKAFLDESQTVQMHLLAHMLHLIGNNDYPASRQALLEICNRICSGRGGTLSGCYIRPVSGRLEILAEYGRTAPEPVRCEAGDIQIFDRRWRVLANKKGWVKRLGFDGGGRRHSAIKEGEGWPARMNEMIPVLETLDDRRYNPHFMNNGQAQCLHPLTNKQISDYPLIIWPLNPDRAIRSDRMVGR